VVKITRKTTPEAQAMTAADAGKYQLTLKVIADNPANTSCRKGPSMRMYGYPFPGFSPVNRSRSRLPDAMLQP